MRGLSLVGAVLALALSLSAAVADDWHAAKLRGKVLQLVDGQWEPLRRGDAVPDDRVIRTLGGGRVTFVRGNEMVELGGNTQIQIHDRNGSRPFTTVLQHFGRVEVEAEVLQVQHFAVKTPHLAAVVKGTRFLVISGENESEVRVRRGAVAVENSADGSNAVVVAGQSAQAAAGEVLQVAGRGELPVILNAKGAPAAPEQTNGSGSKQNAGNGNGNAGSNGNGNPGGSGNGNGGGDGNASGSGNGNGGGNGNGNAGGNGNGNAGDNGNGNAGGSGNDNAGGNDNGNAGGNGNGNGNR